jgi:hypothetical protein
MALSTQMIHHSALRFRKRLQVPVQFPSLLLLWHQRPHVGKIGQHLGRTHQRRISLLFAGLAGFDGIPQLFPKGFPNALFNAVPCYPKRGHDEPRRIGKERKEKLRTQSNRPVHQLQPPEAFAECACNWRHLRGCAPGTVQLPRCQGHPTPSRFLGIERCMVLARRFNGRKSRSWPR